MQGRRPSSGVEVAFSPAAACPAGGLGAHYEPVGKPVPRLWHPPDSTTPEGLFDMLLSTCVAVAIALLEPASRAAEPRVRFEVVDFDDGRPLPCRVTIQDDSGVWYFARSESAQGSAVDYRKQSLTDKSIVEMHATLSAHPFGVEIPSGRKCVAAFEHGKEYLPERIEFVAGEGHVSRTVKLRRFSELAKSGWFSGETHPHRDVAELPNIMRAEDLDIAFPLTDWVRETFVTPIAKRPAGFKDPGGKVILVDDRRLIAARNTEYELFTVNGKSHTLGAFFVINHKTPLDIAAPPVKPVAERVRREGALLELDKHNWPWSMMLVPIMGIDLFELSNNHVWQTRFGFTTFGEAPAEYMKIERDAKGYTEHGWLDFGFQNYYALLNCGFRLRPTAGTASGVHPVPLGFGRVYVKTVGPLTVDSWMKGLDAGRSFVTTGPLVSCSLNGSGLGEPIKVADEYRLRFEATSAAPIETVEIVVNGEVARSLSPENKQAASGAYSAVVDLGLAIKGSAWVAVRCFEKSSETRRNRFAHTAPWWVDVPGDKVRPRKAEVDYLIKRVEEQIVRSGPVLPDAAMAEYREALRIYREIARDAR